MKFIAILFVAVSCLGQVGTFSNPGVTDSHYSKPLLDLYPPPCKPHDIAGGVGTVNWCQHVHAEKPIAKPATPPVKPVCTITGDLGMTEGCTSNLPEGARVVPQDSNFQHACKYGEEVGPRVHDGIAYCLKVDPYYGRGYNY